MDNRHSQSCGWNNSSIKQVKIMRILNKLKFWKKKEPKMSVDEEEKVWYKNLGIKIPEPETTKKEKTITEYKENITKVKGIIAEKNKKLMLKKAILIIYGLLHIGLSFTFFMKNEFLLPIGVLLPTAFFIYANYQLSDELESHLVRLKIKKHSIA